MSIHSTRHSVQDLFGRKYYIDFYQRDYKWEQQHVETLLDDVFFRFEADFKPEVDATPEAISKYAWYYLSTYVTNAVDGRVFIVDGQQRLTTITLILIKLYHLAKTHGQEHHDDWLKRSIYGADAQGFTFWMGTGSREEALSHLFYEGVSPDGEDGAAQDLTVRNIYRNFQFLSSYLDDRLKTPRQVEAFTLYFMTRVEMVELHIDDSRDVAMVFEVINDRGERLQPYEVFKGELLGQLTKPEVENTYYGIWTSSIDPLQTIDKNEPDRFFRLLFRSKNTNTRQEYRDFDGEYQRAAFSKWDDRLRLKRKPERVKEFLRDEVSWYSRLYHELLTMSRTPGTHVYYNVRLNRHDRQHVLVMSAILPGDPDREEKVELVSRLFDRHYTLLQLGAAYDSNQFTESIIALNSAIRDQDCPEIQAAFDRQLLEDISTARGIEVEDPFQWSLFRDTGYDLGSRFLRYFFARVEYFIADEAGLDTEATMYNLVANQGKKNGHHIEHILSNNDESRALFDEDVDEFIRERNRLGALVLLRGPDNISAGNKPYQVKLKVYSHGTLTARTLTNNFYVCNPDFHKFRKKHNLDFHPIERFDREAIDDRHRLYFELAKRIWGDDSFPLK